MLPGPSKAKAWARDIERSLMSKVKVLLLDMEYIMLHGRLEPRPQSFLLFLYIYIYIYIYSKFILNSLEANMKSNNITATKMI